MYISSWIECIQNNLLTKLSILYKTLLSGKTVAKIEVWDTYPKYVPSICSRTLAVDESQFFSVNFFWNVFSCTLSIMILIFEWHCSGVNIMLAQGMLHLFDSHLQKLTMFLVLLIPNAIRCCEYDREVDFCAQSGHTQIILLMIPVKTAFWRRKNIWNLW